MKHSLKIFPSDIEVPISEGETILTALKKANVYIKASCGGCASCGTCVIKIQGGDQYLHTMESPEEKLLGNVFHLTKERLACQAKVFGDVEIDLSEHDPKAQEEKIRKNQTRKVLLKKGGKEEEKEDADQPRKKREGGLKRPKTFKYSEED